METCRISDADLTRSQLIAELEDLRAAGVFERVRSLRNRYPAPALKSINDNQLLAAIHESADEWEADLRLLIPDSYHRIHQ
jgi:hypothetical protein